MVVGVVAGQAAYAEPPPTRHFVVLHYQGQEVPFRPEFDSAIQEALRRASGGPVNVYFESLDAFNFPAASQSGLVAEYLQAKYAGRRVDALIAISDGAVSFARQHRDIFANAPIVAVAQTTPLDAGDDLTGLRWHSSNGDMLRLVLRLLPDTERIYLVDGALQPHEDLEAAFGDDVAALGRHLDVEYLLDLPIRDLVERLKRIPSRSVVCFRNQTMRDRSTTIDLRDGLAEVLRVSPVPVFSFTGQLIGMGMVGVYQWQVETDSDLIAAMASSIANGVSARDIPTREMTIRSALDWRQLQRWHVPQGRIPPESLVLFYQPSFFELYRRYVIAGLLVFAVQTCLIAGLLVQRSRRRSAEQILVGKEAHLRTSYERIRDLAGRLITAQEAERSRIARELHDDACQEVAGVAVDISNLLHRGVSREPAVQQALSSVHTRVTGLAESLRLLSHDLHPSVLQHIGLVAALEAHCAEAERHYDVQIRLVTDGEVEPTEPAVALALFRITQEALGNAARHGQARHATVALARSDDDLTLSVADDGVGFDIAGARQNGGLGLVSMEERARLVKGDVTIRSQLQQGTTIDVRVPINGADDPHVIFH